MEWRFEACIDMCQGRMNVSGVFASVRMFPFWFDSVYSRD